MGVRSNVVTVLASLALFACGGAKTEAKTAEANPWADYKGTYATAGSGHGDAPTKAAKADKADKKDQPKADKTDDAVAAAPAPAAAPASKKPSRGMINGESVSSIGLDAFADASKSAIKGKVVSTKFVVGPQYEEMQVQMKGGSVQVIRPAANPASDGPAIASPKARSGGLAKTDSSWYDEDADVLVVVSAPKKASAQKTLGTILKK